jgi:hypothetical protein
MEHILKIKSCYFKQVLSGEKTFEIRKVDRLYSVGDKLILFEIAENGKETGESCIVRVIYLLTNPAYGLMDGYCIMSIKRCGKQNRGVSGNKPSDEREVFEYAESLGKSVESAQNFLNYYSATGWKMKNGIPIADWKAAFRNWKDYENQHNSDKNNRENEKITTILPLLLTEMAKYARRRQEIHFKDPCIGTVVRLLGFDFFNRPLNAFQKKETIGHYLDSKKIGIGEEWLFTNSRGSGALEVPTIEEYILILKKRRERQKAITPD